MSRNRQPRVRKLVIDFLEDRAVPSTMTAAAATGGDSDQTLTNELNQFGGQVNSAYAAFATTVRQAELTLVSTTDSSGNPVAATGTPTTVMATINQQLNTLSQTLASAASSASSAASVQLGSVSALLQAQLTGGTAGSVSSQVANLFGAGTAGSTDGSVPQASLPLLFAAVDGAIAASYNSTSLDGYYFATGQLGSSGSGTSGNSSMGTAFDLTTVGTQENAAYSSFATAVRQAEATLLSTTDASGNPVAPTGTPTTVSSTIAQQITTLSNAIGSAFSSTPAASSTGALLGSYTSGPGSLSVELAGLLQAASAGSTDGSVPQASLGLLFAAVDGAIAASYDTTAVSTYLLATNQNLIPSSSGNGTTGTGTNTGTTTSTGTVTTGVGGNGTGTVTTPTGTTGTGTVTTGTGGNGTGTVTTPTGTIGTTTPTGTTGTGTTGTGTTGTGTTGTGTTGTGTTGTGTTGTGTTGTGSIV